MNLEPTITERRRQTRSSIYQYLYGTAEFCSKQSLARELSLSLPTVYQNLKELMDAGLVDYSGEQRSTGGRRAMTDLGCVAGVGNNAFNPAGTFTRAQAAVILTRLTLGASADNYVPSKVSFKDVPTTFWGYKFVEYAAQSGYVAGVGNGNYNPNATLTGYQWAAMHFAIDWSKPWTIPGILKQTGVRQREMEHMKSSGHKELMRSVKFLLFSVSAGAIELGSFSLLELTDWSYWPRYLIALVLSVLWNFTLNRRYTFRSASNVPVAMWFTSSRTKRRTDTSTASSPRSSSGNTAAAGRTASS